MLLGLTSTKDYDMIEGEVQELHYDIAQKNKGNRCSGFLYPVLLRINIQ